MKTIEINLYKFDELSDEAKQKAYAKWLDSEREFNWGEDYLESLKHGLKHFGFELRKWDIDYYNATHAYIDFVYTESNGYCDEEDTLRGVRLWKFLNRRHMGYWCKYQNMKRGLLDGNCPFTGVCFDESFLDPVREFMEIPEDISFKELMKECVYKLLKDLKLDYEYQQSYGFFCEEMAANDIDFTEDGNIY